MKSWSELIEKIQGLFRAFEEDLGNISNHSSNQATTAASSTQCITQQLNSHDANISETVEARPKQLKSYNGLTVIDGEDMPTSVQEYPLQLQPLKSKAAHQLQKKYIYVNKKFVVCRESRRDERDIELVGTETCSVSTVNDPFEFVGTQTTPVSNADSRDKRSCAMQLMFDESPDDELMPVVDDKSIAARQKCRRQQHRPIENGLKQLAEDIADAEAYSLIISQQCSTKSQNEDQTIGMISSAHNNITESTRISQDIMTSETGTVTKEISDNKSCDETAAGRETDADIVSVHDRQSSDSEFVAVGLNVENGEKEAQRKVLWTVAEKHCCVSDVAMSHLDISIELNDETEQIHSAQVPSISVATDNTDIPETCLGRSTVRSDTACQISASQKMLCTVETHSVSHAEISTSSAVSTPYSTVVIDTALNVLDGMQHSTSHSKAVASVSSPNSLHHDGHICLSSMSVDGSDRINMKRSCKSCHKAKQKKHKNENMCYASSGLRNVKQNAANLTAAEIEHDSSG